MKYLLCISLVLSHAFLHAGCTFSSEQERQSKILYISKAQKILTRSVMVTTHAPVHLPDTFMPEDFYVEVLGLEQEKKLLVQDFLRQCDGDYDTWLQDIVYYFEKRDRQKEYLERKKDFDVDVVCKTQSDNTQAIVACMSEILIQNRNR